MSRFLKNIRGIFYFIKTILLSLIGLLSGISLWVCVGLLLYLIPEYLLGTTNISSDKLKNLLYITVGITVVWLISVKFNDSKNQ